MIIIATVGMLLAFAPFIAFAIIDRFVGSTPGLIAAAIVSIGLLLRDISAGRSMKILEIGTGALFIVLAVFALFIQPTWSVIGVRVIVDAGLLAIAVISTATRQPFTLQYAREQTPPEIWSHPEFIRTNYVITAAWALAFAVMVVAELVLLYVPAIPRQVGFIAIIAALVAAVKFTGWYPERERSVS